jgi:NAD(P)H dehydrogenase (quinone)
MKASAILAHPYSLSFNHAIFNMACNTLTENNVIVFRHDLCKEGFDPILTEGELGKKESKNILVKEYAQELIESDLLIFVHPNWWGQPPAILKGYIDRVIRPPYAYDFPPDDNGSGLPLAKLKGKYGVVFNTSNTDKKREEEYFNDPLEQIWGKCIFGFCGIEKYYRKMFGIIAGSTDEERRGWLEEVREIVENIILICSDSR